MYKLLLCAVLVVAVAPLASADSIMLVSGASNVTASGPITTAFNFNGWDILSIVLSNSPSVSPFALDLTVIAACGNATCASNPLQVFGSDTGFTSVVPTGNFQLAYGAVQTDGSTGALAWAASNNTLFQLGLANLIGSVGPFSAPGGFGAVTGGPAEGPSAYSITIEETFSGSGFYSADAAVTTPEPAALVLFGSGLTLIPLVLRRMGRFK